MTRPVLEPTLARSLDVDDAQRRNVAHRMPPPWKAKTKAIMARSTVPSIFFLLCIVTEEKRPGSRAHQLPQNVLDQPQPQW
jgi:hypothetical protein